VKLIVDADFGLMNDDAWATLLALRDSRAEVLGVSVVAGNFDLTSEYRNARHVLDHVGRADIPVLKGASRPLVHERGPWEDRLWGGWALDAGEQDPDDGHGPDAVNFIVREARAHPEQVTVLALGPLTTLALAFRREPALARLLDRLVIMGGSIDGLPNGGGNVTPNAEFNIWVDPEAARIVLRSGADITLEPLNVTRLAKFEESDLRQIVAVDGPVAELFREHVLPVYSEPPGTYGREALYEYGLCDPLTTACLIEPGICETTPMFVEVETAPVLAYGTTYAYVLGAPVPPDVSHPDSVAAMKREHLTGPNAWAWTGLIQPDHPPYWTTPPSEVSVVTSVDVARFKRWFLETITR
jgi:inosine-uridine nucleoside N-ribohydrolase